MRKNQYVPLIITHKIGLDSNYLANCSIKMPRSDSSLRKDHLAQKILPSQKTIGTQNPLNNAPKDY